MWVESPHGETRHVLVDDTDERITYTGGESWKQDYSEGPDIGTHGKVWNSSHHFTTSSGPSLSFAFQGSSVTLWGSIESSGNKSIPSWECYLDGSSTPFDSTGESDWDENNEVLCRHSSLDPNVPHTVTLNVTGVGVSPFRFDSIDYTPTSQEDFGDAAIWLRPNDTIVQPQTGFQLTSAKNNLLANSTDARATIDFVGTTVAAYGMIKAATPRNAPKVSWKLDDEDYQNFSVPTHYPQDQHWLHYFTTPSRPYGKHRLELNYYGQEGIAPLYIPGFIIYNGTKLPSGQTLSTSNSTDNSSSGHKDGSNIPAIVGGVVGGVAVLALLIIALLFWRRRRRYRNRVHATIPTQYMESAPNSGVTYTGGSPTEGSPFESTNLTGYNSVFALISESSTALVRPTGKARELARTANVPDAPPAYSQGV